MRRPEKAMRRTLPLIPQKLWYGNRLASICSLVFGFFNLESPFAVFLKIGYAQQSIRIPQPSFNTSDLRICFRVFLEQLEIRFFRLDSNDSGFGEFIGKVYGSEADVSSCVYDKRRFFFWVDTVFFFYKTME